MDFSFYLIFLIAGYMFSSSWRGSSFHIEAASGNRFYFRVGFYAVFVFALSTLIHLITRVLSGNICSFFTGKYEYIDFTFIPDGSSDLGGINSYLLWTISIALFIGMFGGPILHKTLSIIFYRWDLDYTFLYLAVENNDFEKLLLESFDEKKTVSITTKNRKVYIGYLTEGINPWVSRNNLKLLPVISGYRRRLDQRFKFTTFYQDIYQNVIAHIKDKVAKELGLVYPELGNKKEEFREKVNTQIDEQINLYEIVVPTREIQSINKFDLENYQKFVLQGRARGKKYY